MISSVPVSGSVTPMAYGESTATNSESGDSAAAEQVQETGAYQQHGDQSQFTSTSYASTSYDGKLCNFVFLHSH